MAVLTISTPGLSVQVFLPSFLPHPDAMGVGFTGGGACCHGTVTSRVIRYRVGIGQVSWEGIEAGQLPCDLLTI